MIRVVGSSGTAGTSWVGDALMISDKLAVGVLCVGTSHKFRKIALKVTFNVAPSNDKLFSIGPMTQGKFEQSRICHLTNCQRMLLSIMAIPLEILAPLPLPDVQIQFRHSYRIRFSRDWKEEPAASQQGRKPTKRRRNFLMVQFRMISNQPLQPTSGFTATPLGRFV
jgi:hypothetical protein